MILRIISSFHPLGMAFEGHLGPSMGMYFVDGQTSSVGFSGRSKHRLPIYRRIHALTPQT